MHAVSLLKKRTVGLICCCNGFVITFTLDVKFLFLLRIFAHLGYGCPVVVSRPIALEALLDHVSEQGMHRKAFMALHGMPEPVAPALEGKTTLAVKQIE